MASIRQIWCLSDGATCSSNTYNIHTHPSGFGQHAHPILGIAKKDPEQGASSFTLPTHSTRTTDCPAGKDALGLDHRVTRGQWLRGGRVKQRRQVRGRVQRWQEARSGDIHPSQPRQPRQVRHYLQTIIWRCKQNAFRAIWYNPCADSVAPYAKWVDIDISSAIPAKHVANPILYFPTISIGRRVVNNWHHCSRRPRSFLDSCILYQIVFIFATRYTHLCLRRMNDRARAEPLQDVFSPSLHPFGLCCRN